ncbi:MAG: Txe/YoeB family addiction module toxin [Oscillospiraceae bacterium]|nr:Txe/YoeB family addiction module toxin [Oscillospiraceae bacterium]
MAKWKVQLSKKAQQDVKLLIAANLNVKSKELLDILAENPFQSPPFYESLSGNLEGRYSRRINIQHRLVYRVLPNAENLRDENGDLYTGIVLITRMWSHYE